MLISHSQAISPNDIAAGNWEQIGEFDVPPQPSSNDNVKLLVGVYEKSIPAPAIVLKVTPDPNAAPDTFVADLHRLDEDDSYQLIYFFGNYGGPAYHVQIWEQVE